MPFPVRDKGPLRVGWGLNAWVPEKRGTWCVGFGGGHEDLGGLICHSLPRQHQPHWSCVSSLGGSAISLGMNRRLSLGAGCTGECVPQRMLLLRSAPRSPTHRRTQGPESLCLQKGKVSLRSSYQCCPITGSFQARQVC